MEHLTVAMSELYNRNSRPHFPKVIHSRRNTMSLAEESSPGTSDQGLDERIFYACKSAERTVTLPIVRRTDHCTNYDVNSNIEESPSKMSVPACQTTGEHKKQAKDVVIVQLYEENNAKRDTLLYEGASNVGRLSPYLRSPKQQRKQISRKNVIDGCEKSPSLRRASFSVVEQNKSRFRNDALVINGFSQMDLKNHNEKYKQRLNIYVQSEEQRSRNIVEEWLKSLP